jgi:hypothetical protein
LTEITRSVTADDLRSLLDGASEATIAWVEDGHLTSWPTAFNSREGRYRFGLPAGTMSEGVVVSLSVDAGAMYFDLRGVRVRGPVKRIDAPEGTAPSLEWFEVGVERETAWHYGTLRENERRDE